MTRFLLHIYDYLSAHKRLAWMLMLGMLTVLVVLMVRMRYREDIAAFLPMDKQSEKYSVIYNNTSGQKRIVLSFTANSKAENGKGDEEVDTTEVLKHSMSAFGELLTQMDTIGCVRNLQVQIDEMSVLSTMDYIWKHYPCLMDSTEYARLDTLLSSEGFVDQQMHANLEMLMMFSSGIAAQSMHSDPLHLSQNLAKSLSSLNLCDAFSFNEGYMFTGDMRCGLVFFESPYGVSESAQNQQMGQLLDDAIQKFYAEYGTDVTISAIGAPLIAATNAEQIKHDSLFAMLVAVVLIMAILVYSFNRISDIFWIFFSIAVGVAFALGVMSMIKPEISVIVIGIGAVIIGIAVNYPLHFIDHLKHENNKRNALKEMIMPLVVGNITTVSAFLCLVVLDAEAMRDLGLFGSLVLFGTILFVIVFLPVLIPMRKDSNKGGRELPDWLVSPSLGKGLTKIMPWVVVVLTVILSYFSLNTSFDSDMQHINYMTDSQRKNYELLTSSMNQNDSTSLLYVVTEGKTIEEALLNNEQQIQAISKVGGIRKLASISRLIPSQHRQQQSLKRWDELWRKHSNLYDQLQKSCPDYGFATDAFAPFYSLVKHSDTSQFETNDMQAQDWVKTSYIMQDETGVRIVNYLYVDKSIAEDIKQTVKAGLTSDAYAFDAADISHHLVDVLSDSFNYIGFVCGFVVFIFLWLSFGRLELSLLAFLPLTVSWIWILGLMDICSIQFNIINIILATFIFGQGDDYTIFIAEGLVYEYAYGKKVVRAFKNSVALSAIIMFFGIGALIIAKHPALRSLAEVAIVGMFTVVVMAYYLPPLLFRWMTTVNGELREYPMTIKRIVYSFYALNVFLISMSIWTPLIGLYAIFVRNQACLSRFIHQVMYYFARTVIRGVPGAPFRVVNEHGEDFRRPSIIVCNHQSQLDLMAVLSLYPKITILTKEWVWNNPYYGHLIRASEFYPVTNSVDDNMKGLRSMLDRGYSVVIFPEGTRSAAGIQRFHKGAFLLAQQLQVDIIPVYLHGFNNVLPRHDFMLREGRMTMHIGKRMAYDEFKDMTDRQLCTLFHRQFVNVFAQMRQTYETASYWAIYARYKYMYKGAGVEHRAKKIFKDKALLAQQIDCDCTGLTEKHFDNPGRGELPLLFAWVHPSIQVYAHFSDEDDYLLASHLSHLPQNLHLELKG